jgi:WD40 repeat protein
MRIRVLFALKFGIGFSAALALLTVAHPGLLAGKGVVEKTDTGVLPAAVLAHFQAHTTHAFSAAFSPDGKILVTGGDGPPLRLWGGFTGKPRAPVKIEPRAPVRCVVIAPDGKLFASGNNLGQVKLWKLPSGLEVQALEGHKHAVTSLAFSPDGKLLASASLDQLIQLWNPVTGKLLRTIKGDPVDSLAFAPDGKLLAAGSSEGPVRLWEVATGKLKHTLKGHQGQVFALAFSPDGKTLVSADGSRASTIRFWDPATGRQRLSLPAHQQQGGEELRKQFEALPPKAGVRSVAFSPDGRLLASAGQDEIILLWEVATARVICRLEKQTDGASCVAFAPGGRRLVSLTFNGTASLWDVGRLFTGGQVPAKTLTAAQLQKLWTTLLNPDPAPAYAALEALRAAPQDSLPFLKMRFLPIPHAKADQLVRWVEELESSVFRTREKAFQELSLRGEASAPALRAALEGKPSLEKRWRIEKLLAQLEPAGITPKRLRLLRTIQVLEGTGATEARALLEQFAKGLAQDGLTQEAQRALTRMKAKSVP